MCIPEVITPVSRSFYLMHGNLSVKDLILMHRYSLYTCNTVILISICVAIIINLHVFLKFTIHIPSILLFTVLFFLHIFLIEK